MSNAARPVRARVRPGADRRGDRCLIAGGRGEVRRSADPVCDRRRHSIRRGVPVSPQPPDVAAERLGKQRQGGEEDAPGQTRRQDVRGRDRQHDPLRRGDDLAPVARRQRRAHPWQRPGGREERVACRADREHPRAGRAGDVHAEDEDQERVDLSVELRAQRRRGPGPARHPSVDRVERERDRRERHQHRDRRGLLERVRDQRRHSDGERGAGERHPVGDGETLGAVARETVRQPDVRDRPAGQSDDPAGAAEPAAGPGDRGEQQQLGDQSRHRAGVNHAQRASAWRSDRSRRTPGRLRTRRRARAQSPRARTHRSVSGRLGRRRAPLDPIASNARRQAPRLLPAWGSCQG